MSRIQQPCVAKQSLYTQNQFSHTNNPETTHTYTFHGLVHAHLYNFSAVCIHTSHTHTLVRTQSKMEAAARSQMTSSGQGQYHYFYLAFTKALLLLCLFRYASLSGLVDAYVYMYVWINECMSEFESFYRFFHVAF